MKSASGNTLIVLGALLVFSVAVLLPQTGAAHCDTLDGPVIADARAALAAGEVTPVLKWVRSEDESEIRAVFAEAMAVRKLGTPALALADRSFFETLVRVHRAGEGAPYTGLKPAGAVEPVVAKADQALEQGSVDSLVKAILNHTESGIRERFNRALEARKHTKESVAAGREYVEAYIGYVHYVEGIAQVVHGSAGHQHPSSPPEHRTEKESVHKH